MPSQASTRDSLKYKSWGPQELSTNLSSLQKSIRWFKAIKSAWVIQIENMLDLFPDLIHVKMMENPLYPLHIPRDLHCILGQNTSGMTALHYSLLCLISEKLKHSIVDKSEVLNIRTHIVHLMIQYTSPVEVAESRWGYSNTALHLAALTNDANIINKLLNKGGRTGLCNHFGLTPLDIIYNTPSLQSLYIQQISSRSHQTIPVEYTERRGRSRQLKPLNETIKYLNAEPLTLGELLTEREVSPPRYELGSTTSRAPHPTVSETHSLGASKLTQEITDAIKMKSTTVAIPVRTDSSETLVEVTKKHRKKSMDLGTFIKMVKKRWNQTKKNGYLSHQEKLDTTWDKSSAQLDLCWKADAKQYSVLSLNPAKTGI